MHQGYFERKLSQPLTGSLAHSMTPKLFSRLKEESAKSPERINTEHAHFAPHSPSVHGQRHSTHNNTFFGSSAKISAKVKEHILNTDRLRNRGQQTYYNPKSNHNLTTDLMRSKSSRNNCVTKTEPADVELSYASQINKLLQKINKLKYDLGQSQERESQYLGKLANLEKENKSLQMVIEEKEKKMQDVSQKSKEDKLRMYQFLTELEAHKQNNSDKQCWDEVSTVRLSEICDSSRRLEKGFSLDKGIQVIEGTNSLSECPKCQSLTNCYDYLINKLNEADQASRILLQENTTMRESMVKAKRAENDYVKARSEIEKKALEIQSDFDKQGQYYIEINAENIAIRKILKESMEYDSTQSQGYSENKRLSQIKIKKELSQQKIAPVPASLRALMGAERVLKIVN